MMWEIIIGLIGIGLIILGYFVPNIREYLGRRKRVKRGDCTHCGNYNYSVKWYKVKGGQVCDICGTIKWDDKKRNLRGCEKEDGKMSKM